MNSTGRRSLKVNADASAFNPESVPQKDPLKEVSFRDSKK